MHFEFQNILCYCLTDVAPEQTDVDTSFQNILCYCLTTFINTLAPIVCKFQNILCYCLTSISFANSCIVLISKHPMLLFNKYQRNGFTFVTEFQNILCYCLTNVFKPFSQLKSLYTPILHYLIQNYQPANHFFKCVFI